MHAYLSTLDVSRDKNVLQSCNQEEGELIARVASGVDLVISRAIAQAIVLLASMVRVLAFMGK